MNTIIRFAAGVIFGGCGVAADVYAGVLVLSDDVGEGLILHIFGGLIWAAGVILVTQRPLALQNATPVTPIRFGWLSGWTIAAIFLGLVSFPGLGTLGGTVAFFAMYLAYRVRRIRPHQASPSVLGDFSNSLMLPAVQGRVVEQPIQPYVDVLRDSYTLLRRAVVRTLGDRMSPENIKLLRELLTDENLQVRIDAAATLTRLEDEFYAALAEAKAESAMLPGELSPARNVVALLRRFATNGLLDEVSGRYFLAEACDILAHLTTQYPTRDDLWLDLARTHHDLGNEAAAQTSLDQVLALKPSHADAFELAIAIAFKERRWDRLFALTEQRQAVAIRDPEIRRLLDWWGEAKLKRRTMPTKTEGAANE